MLYQDEPAGIATTPPALREGSVEFLAPLVRQWFNKLKQAQRAKRGFNEIAKQCNAFYSSASGFMWEDAFRTKYMGQGIKVPKFKVTVNKAFELVALFGPYLFWKYPGVSVQSYDRLEIGPELFGDPQDEMVQMQFQQMQQELQADLARQQTRNSLMQKYLNYSQREQPGGGLKMHAELAITEALIKGRGCLWTEAYAFPGSQRQLTGRFYDSVDNLLVDPDCADPSLRDAQFIARRHLTQAHVLEDRLGYPRGFFRKHGAGRFESAESQAVNQTDSARQERRNGGGQDLVEWFEVWSKAGVGTRVFGEDDVDAPMGLTEGLQTAFEDVVGNYAYLVLVEGIPYPLNAPAQRIRSTNPAREDASDEDVQEMFQWRASNYGPPFPCYLDDRWPVAVLDFYRHPNSCWPIAPLAPALGELIALNIMISAYTEQAYENRKHIIAYLKSAIKDVQGKIDSADSPALIEINDNVHKSVNDIIQYLNKPEMNGDLGNAIAFVSEMFDKRTGLTEFMYAVSSTQSRTARDVAAKEEKAAIRPEKMANDVANWMTESANLEKFLAGWVLEGQHLQPLLGRHGAFFWDQLIAAEDPEVFVREMQATVEANECRKPNRERVLANLQEMLQFTLPMLQQYATDTGDTEPLNAFLSQLGASMEQDVTAWRLGPWRPEPDPQQQQQQELLLQFEQAKQQAELTIKQVDAQKAQLEVQQTQMEVQKATLELQLQAESGGVDLQAKQLEFVFDQQEHQQELQQQDEEHQLNLQHQQQEHMLNLLNQREQDQQKLEQMQQEGRIKRAAQSAARPTGKSTT